MIGLIGRVRIPRSAYRFLLVGVLNTLIDLSIYLVLRQLGLPILLANFISTSAGMAFSYIGNRSFTFRSAHGRHLHPGKQVTLFLMVTGFGLWVLQPVVIVAVGAGMAGGVLGRGPLVAVVPKLCGIAVGLIWNYTLYSRLVFRSPRA